MVTKRIECMPNNVLSEAIETLKKFGISFYSSDGQFNYDEFRKKCIETADLLWENEKPHPETGIRYQFAVFAGTIQTVTGLRYVDEFMGF